jgi:anti-sigma-K factor RskA
MASSMPSDQLQLLIAGYILGDLDPEEAATFEQLLAENPAMIVEIERMQKALELAYASPEVLPPVRLRSAVLLPVQPAPQPPFQGGSSTTQRRAFPWGRVMGTAAAVLLVSLGISNYHLWQTLQAVQAQRQQFRPLTYLLRATSRTNSATAMVVVDPNTLEANLIVNNLPPPPPGKVYVLWTVLEEGAPLTTDDKSAILTEVFQVDAQGDFAETISVPEVYRSEALITKVAVTVEDADAPQDHVGSPILMTES